jgi:hypothetical protein
MTIPEGIRLIGIKSLDLGSFVRDFKPLMRSDWDLEAGSFPFRLVDRPVLRRRGHLWNVHLRDGQVIISPRKESSETEPRRGYPFGSCIVRSEPIPAPPPKALSMAKSSDIKNLIWTQVPHRGEYYQVRIPVYVPTTFILKTTHKPWGSTWHWDLTS